MIKAKLVPIRGQDSLKKMLALAKNPASLLGLISQKVASEIKQALQGMGLGSLVASIEATIQGIRGDAQAIGWVESGRQAITKKLLKITLKTGHVIWRRRAKAVMARPLVDDAAEKVFSQADPLDLSAKV